MLPLRFGAHISAENPDLSATLLDRRTRSAKKGKKQPEASRMHRPESWTEYGQIEPLRSSIPGLIDRFQKDAGEALQGLTELPGGPRLTWVWAYDYLGLHGSRSYALGVFIGWMCHSHPYDSAHV